MCQTTSTVIQGLTKRKAIWYCVWFWNWYCCHNVLCMCYTREEKQASNCLHFYSFQLFPQWTLILLANLPDVFYKIWYFTYKHTPLHFTCVYNIIVACCKLPIVILILSPKVFWFVWNTQRKHKALWIWNYETWKNWWKPSKLDWTPTPPSEEFWNNEWNLVQTKFLDRATLTFIGVRFEQ